MTQLRGLLLTFCLSLSSVMAWAQHVPPGTSPALESVFVQCSSLMNGNRYDSAFVVLSDVYVNRLSQCTRLDRYYMHALMSEILYYNALFVQGKVESEHSLAIAASMHNDSLIANSQNMLGLIHINLSQFDQALIHFRAALHHFPERQNNPFLAYRYHVLANMGECFIKMQMPDSAMHYSARSKVEALEMRRFRGVAFALLNEAQVMALKNDWNAAQVLISEAKQAVDTTNHRDVVQILIAEEMRVALRQGDTAKVRTLCSKGLLELQSEWNTDYARLEFLKTASALFVEMKDDAVASDLLRRQVELVGVIRAKQEVNQAVVLRDYVHKSESLLYADQLEKSLQNEIFWRRVTIVFAIVLLLVCITAGCIYFSLIQRKRNLEALKMEAQMQQELKRVEVESNQKSLDAIALERNRIASDLHDDLGASLSGINIYSSLAMKPGLDEATRLKWVEKIKALSGQMNENMSDIVWSIYSVHDNWPSVVLRMQAYASEVLSLQNIAVQFEVDKRLQQMTASLELRHHLMMCFKEAIINICKYSEAKSVQILLRQKDELLQLQIQDDGIGFDKDGRQNGNGLKNMERRMVKLNGRLSISSMNSKGTIILFEVPFSSETAGA